METNLHAMNRLKNADRLLILDPAPATALPDDMLTGADFITPNEVELSMLAGIPVAEEDEFLKASRILIARGARNIIAKAGRKGAYIVTGTDFRKVPGFTVDAVDPTAAGDSFNAGFALALSEGKTVLESVRFANAVAALSTTAFGAQSAMPVRAAVERFLKENT